MTLWGKLIDHDRCIGCHACSVACKSENEVPLGVFRTWVKQVEKGQGPAARRHFGVLRCNQCERAPCVAICPTAAMHRRPDGIVDFDHRVCIGCKACIQACPYDAIYMDPESHTAAKCNFCAHRMEVGLEPACVAVCPTQALQVSDLEDPTSPVAMAAAREAVSVRKPELGTRPKVFYKGADESVLQPRSAQRPAQGLWGQSRTEDETHVPLLETGRSTGAPAAARVAYDVPREGFPWGGAITAYMVSKAIAGGILMLGGAALTFLPKPAVVASLGAAPPLIAFVLLLLTQIFLVGDLKRPERFFLLLLRPQSKSWLVKGAFVLLGATLISALWGLVAVRGVALPAWGWEVLGVSALLSGVAAAGYTALLFGQAQGRRFWQSPLLLPHLVVQAVVAGAAVFGFLFFDTRGILGVSLALNLLMVLGELWSHRDEDTRLAVEWLEERRGTALYIGVLAIGHVFPLTVLGVISLGPGAEIGVFLAGIPALLGLALWDHLYLQAGQAPPLS